MVNNLDDMKTKQIISSQASIETLQEATDEEILAIGGGLMAKFLQDNPIGSVFDLEDEPTEFARYKLGKTRILEVDKNTPSQLLLELKQSKFNGRIEILESLRYKARYIAITFKCSAYMANGRG